MKSNSTASTLITLSLIILFLIVGESIILPFLIALLIWFVVKKIRDVVDKIDPIRKYVPHWIKTIIASIIVFGSVFIVIDILIINIEILSQKYSSFLPNIHVISDKINHTFGLEMGKQIEDSLHAINFNKALSVMLNSFSEILGNFVWIAFYFIFLIVEERLFNHKFKLIFANKPHRKEFEQIFKKVDKSMSSYLSLKSVIALIAAISSWIVFYFVGLEAPIFWAFLIFLLNFIPSIGPILGTLLPSLFAFVQFGNFTNGLIILFVVGAIVMTIGSLLEPKLMGNTLNISPLVAVLSLAIWGTIWGITGMLLAVPITVALIIILAQFPNTRPVAILLSERGRV